MPRRGPTADALLDGGADGAPDITTAEDPSLPGISSDNVDGRGKKKRKNKATRRPGEVDPQAAPRVGSSPYPGLPYPLGATPS